MVAERERFWAYAATFGATWGAVEITAGTFLHALRIPFSGVVLGGLGAGLLVTLRLLFPMRFVVLAAGAVCAGVKLLSPAGAVVGPGIAILVEAGLVELACLPGGAGRWTGALAGALCALWSLTQKLLTQTLFFGMPVLGVYLGLLERAETWLGLPAKGGFGVAAVIVGIALLLGALIGMAGHAAGTAAQQLLAKETG